MGQTEGLDFLENDSQHCLVSLGQVGHKVLHAELGLVLCNTQRSDNITQTSTNREQWFTHFLIIIHNMKCPCVSANEHLYHSFVDLMHIHVHVYLLRLK